MSYGIQIKNASGVETFNSQRRGAVFVEFVDVPNNTATTKTYNNLTGRTVFVIGRRYQGANGNYAQPFTITYPSGVPTVTFAAVLGGASWWVFAQ